VRMYCCVHVHAGRACIHPVCVRVCLCVCVCVALCMCDAASNVYGIARRLRTLLDRQERSRCSITDRGCAIPRTRSVVMTSNWTRDGSTESQRCIKRLFFSVLYCTVLYGTEWPSLKLPTAASNPKGPCLLRRPSLWGGPAR
jgi:hypothetical protein